MPILCLLYINNATDKRVLGDIGPEAEFDDGKHGQRHVGTLLRYFEAKVIYSCHCSIQFIITSCWCRPIFFIALLLLLRLDIHFCAQLVINIDLVLIA